MKLQRINLYTFEVETTNALGDAIFAQLDKKLEPQLYDEMYERMYEMTHSNLCLTLEKGLFYPIDEQN